MKSLSARLLVSVSVLLLLFFGATIVVLDTAFRSAGEQAHEDILDGHLMQLLAAAEPNRDGGLSLPVDLPETRFGRIGSGLYAELRDDRREVIWQSRSSLGLTLPVPRNPPLGTPVFERVPLAAGTPVLAATLAVQWEFPGGELKPYLFTVAESLESFNAQVAGFRRQLFGWFAAVALIMLLSISILMRGLLRPLRQIEAEISEIEDGRRGSLSADLPTELAGVARNLNLLIDSERARSDRYRHTLANLAHSLKTPLAAMRALLGEGRQDREASARINEQIERMDEIVRYQLRKPAASAAETLVHSPVAVRAETERLVAGLKKVYTDKSPEIRVDIDEAASFRGDAGDFLELAGNLIDNACKWCRSKVRVSVRADGGGMRFTVEDDGPGIPDDAKDALMQRGMRLDEATPGHGIGLAVVADIARSAGGGVTIGRSDLGGAAVTVTLPGAAGQR